MAGFKEGAVQLRKKDSLAPADVGHVKLLINSNKYLYTVDENGVSALVQGSNGSSIKVYTAIDQTSYSIPSDANIVVIQNDARTAITNLTFPTPSVDFEGHTIFVRGSSQYSGSKTPIGVMTSNQNIGYVGTGATNGFETRSFTCILAYGTYTWVDDNLNSQTQSTGTIATSANDTLAYLQNKIIAGSGAIIQVVNDPTYGAQLKLSLDGSSINWSSLVNIPVASVSTSGVLTSADYNKFNNKQATLTSSSNIVVNSVSATSISSSNITSTNFVGGKVLVSIGGVVSESPLQSSKLTYLSAVSADIQTQINSKMTGSFNNGDDYCVPVYTSAGGFQNSSSYIVGANKEKIVITDKTQVVTDDYHSPGIGVQIGLQPSTSGTNSTGFFFALDTSGTTKLYNGKWAGSQWNNYWNMTSAGTMQLPQMAGTSGLVAVTSAGNFVKYNLTSADIPALNYLTVSSSLSWSKVTGTPTTLAGYGITDLRKTNFNVTSVPGDNASTWIKLGTYYGDQTNRFEIKITGKAGWNSKSSPGQAIIIGGTNYNDGNATQLAAGGVWYEFGGSGDVANNIVFVKNGNQYTFDVYINLYDSFLNWMVEVTWTAGCSWTTNIVKNIAAPAASTDSTTTWLQKQVVMSHINSPFAWNLNQNLRTTDSPTFGVAQIGTWNFNPAVAHFAHSNMFGNKAGYAFMQQSDGTTYINALGGKSIHLQINDGNDVLNIGASSITANQPFTGTTASFTSQINANDSTNGILFNGNGRIWRDTALQINDPTSIRLRIGGSELQITDSATTVSNALTVKSSGIVLAGAGVANRYLVDSTNGIFLAAYGSGNSGKSVYLETYDTDVFHRKNGTDYKLWDAGNLTQSSIGGPFLPISGGALLGNLNGPSSAFGTVAINGATTISLSSPTFCKDTVGNLVIRNEYAGASTLFYITKSDGTSTAPLMYLTVNGLTLYDAWGGGSSFRLSTPKLVANNAFADYLNVLQLNYTKNSLSTGGSDYATAIELRYGMNELGSLSNYKMPSHASGSVVIIALPASNYMVGIYSSSGKLCPKSSSPVSGVTGLTITSSTWISNGTHWIQIG